MPTIMVGEKLYEFDRVPKECPLCHHYVEPRELKGTFTSITDNDPNVDAYLEIAFKCVQTNCGRIYIGRYYRYHPEDKFQLWATLPSEFKPPAFPEEISQLSPNFVEIYSQAAAAENYKLNQIAGVGYRKALEFLIKDYCITRHPDKAEEIKGAWLATCIKTYVDDANTKRCAERAVWLGNDETHYVRRWEDKDIGDLKTLIRLTMAWIQNNLLTEKYLSDMP
jgi:hypothetical protein